VSTLKIAPQLTPLGFLKVYEKAFKAAGEGWRGALGKYPPQIRVSVQGPQTSKSMGYKRTGTLRKKAGYRLEVGEVGLGGVYYTPYVIEPTRGRVAWPGKEDEAFLAAEKAFAVAFRKYMFGG
jgi:hypothetical protein